MEPKRAIVMKAADKRHRDYSLWNVGAKRPAISACLATDKASKILQTTSPDF